MKAIFLTLLLIIHCVTAGQSCWTGNSKTGLRTNLVNSPCVRYYHCIGGWDGSICRNVIGTSIVYTELDKYKGVNQSEVANLMTCTYGNCNTPIMSNTLCYIGSGRDVHLQEFGKDSKYCVSYKVGDLVTDVHYSIINDTCGIGYLSCCNVSYCNNGA